MDNISVGIEVLTAVVMESPIFWDITPCNSLKIRRFFGEPCRLHLYGSRRRNVPPKRRFNFNVIHGVISQKIKLFDEISDLIQFTL
jgi:hypothetical protein